jgi:hypothetical protein
MHWGMSIACGAIAMVFYVQLLAIQIANLFDLANYLFLISQSLSSN